MNPDQNSYQQPQNPQPQQPMQPVEPVQPVEQPQPTVYPQAPEQPAQVVVSSGPVAPQPTGQPNHFYINQEFKMGRESFAVTDGQNIICVAKKKIMAIKEHMDVYKDEAATQLMFTIQQEKAVAISKVYDVISADGQKMGGFKLEAMQSMMKEHWDILDANGNQVGVIDQDATTAMMGKVGDMMGGGMMGGGIGGLGMGAMGGMAGAGGGGTVIPQKFIATMNNQPVCYYSEEMNIGMFFKMDIDFSPDTAGLYDKTLGIAASILLASKHMQTN